MYDIDRSWAFGTEIFITGATVLGEGIKPSIIDVAVFNPKLSYINGLIVGPLITFKGLVPKYINGIITSEFVGWPVHDMVTTALKK